MTKYLHGLNAQEVTRVLWILDPSSPYGSTETGFVTRNGVTLSPAFIDDAIQTFYDNHVVHTPDFNPTLTPYGSILAALMRLESKPVKEEFIVVPAAASRVKQLEEIIERYKLNETNWEKNFLDKVEKIKELEEKLFDERGLCAALIQSIVLLNREIVKLKGEAE